MLNVTHKLETQQSNVTWGNHNKHDRWLSWFERGCVALLLSHCLSDVERERKKPLLWLLDTCVLQGFIGSALENVSLIWVPISVQPHHGMTGNASMQSNSKTDTILKLLHSPSRLNHIITHLLVAPLPLLIPSLPLFITTAHNTVHN